MGSKDESELARTTGDVEWTVSVSFFADYRSRHEGKLRAHRALKS